MTDLERVPTEEVLARLKKDWDTALEWHNDCNEAVSILGDYALANVGLLLEYVQTGKFPVFRPSSEGRPPA